MTEFEKAKKRYEKRAAKVVPIKEPPKKRPDSITVTIIDDDKEHSFHYQLEGISRTRMHSQRNNLVYQQIIEEMIKKEFGRWLSLRTP